MPAWEWLIPLVVGGLLVHLWRKYFWNKPKIFISLEQAGRRSQPDPFDPQRKIELEWGVTIKLKNNSPYDATDLHFLWPSPQAINNPSLPAHSHLSRFDEKIFKSKFKQSIQKPMAHSSRDRFKDLPDELKKLRFAVSYRNLEGKTFHSLYSNGKCTFPWFRPRGFNA